MEECVQRTRMPPLPAEIFQQIKGHNSSRKNMVKVQNRIWP